MDEDRLSLSDPAVLYTEKRQLERRLKAKLDILLQQVRRRTKDLLEVQCEIAELRIQLAVEFQQEAA